MQKMEKMIRKKIRTNQGFTLAETLLAVLILLMVSAIVAAGIPVAKNAYEKVVLSSNAEVLLSTTISTLRNELGTAMDVSVSTSDDETTMTITYYNSVRESLSEISMDNMGTDIQFQRYYSADASNTENLISDKTATNNLHVTFGSVTYNHKSGVITFENLIVKRDTTILASRDILSIRVITHTED